MARIRKFVAVAVGIAMVVMPAAKMPLHCILTASAEQAGHPTCHMMGDNPVGDQITATAPSDHSCCQVSAARTEALTVPRMPSDAGVLLPPSSANTLLAGTLATLVVREFLVRTAPPPRGAPQPVLCTFLI